MYPCVTLFQYPSILVSYLETKDGSNSIAPDINDSIRISYLL